MPASYRELFEGEYTNDLYTHVDFCQHRKGSTDFPQLCDKYTNDLGKQISPRTIRQRWLKRFAMAAIYLLCEHQAQLSPRIDCQPVDAMTDTEFEAALSLSNGSTKRRDLGAAVMVKSGRRENTQGVSAANAGGSMMQFFATATAPAAQGQPSPREVPCWQPKR